MSDQVWLRRAYDPPGRNDGYRVLVDRVWPRGVMRDALRLGEWDRDVAPSDELRRWYGHRPERWEEFRRRYRLELATGAARGALESLAERARTGRITLVFGARDAEHSQAAVLRELIDHGSRSEVQRGTDGYYQGPAEARISMDRLRRLDYEAVAGLIAAVAALVLHFLHVADEGLLLAIVLAILALMLLRDLRREDREERETHAIEGAMTAIGDIRAAVIPPDTILIGPTSLREESARFSQRARGEMVWFNVCLSMFEPQSLFDALLRPAVENPRVTSIRFILNEGERQRWQTIVLPKITDCAGASSVAEPIWGTLEQSVSCILAETDAGGVEALLSFWGEPFMARAPGRDVPRYIFHVQRHSELIGRLRELERDYRLAAH